MGERADNRWNRENKEGSGQMKKGIIEEGKTYPREEGKRYRGGRQHPPPDASLELRYMPSEDDGQSSPYETQINKSELTKKISQSLEKQKQGPGGPQRPPDNPQDPHNLSKPMFPHPHAQNPNLPPSIQIRSPPIRRPERDANTYSNAESASPSPSPNKGKVLSKRMYKDYDKNVVFYNKLLEDAKGMGRKNLGSVQMRKDSPMKYERGRVHVGTKGGKLPSSPGSGTGTLRIVNPPYNREQDDRMPASNPSTSRQILNRVFDGDLSVNSPSKKYQMTTQDRSFHTPNKSVGEVNEDRFRTTNTLLEQFADTNLGGGIKGSFLGTTGTAGTQNYTLESALDAALESFDYNTLRMGPEDFLLKMTPCISSMRKDIRVGGVLGIYHLLYSNPGLNINQRILDQVILTIITQLTYSESQDETFLICSVELLTLLGKSETATDAIPILKSIISQSEDESLLQTSVIHALLSLGYPGLSSLVELAARDYQETGTAILKTLAATPFIQRSIIVPAMLQELTFSDPYKKQETIAALNRCYHLIHLSGGIPELANILEDGTVERQIVASALRAAGAQGDQILIKMLKYHPNSKVRIAAAGSLAWRRPKYPRIIAFIVEKHEVLQLAKRPPGNMFIYQGKNTGVIDDSYEDDLSFIELNTRDFIAALQRFLTLKNTYTDIQLSHYNEHKNLSQTLNATNSPHKQFLDSFNIGGEELEVAIDHREQEPVPLNIMKALNVALRDEILGVRETAASSIGTIGVPEAVDALSGLIEATKDSDCGVRAMAGWAIGRLGAYAGVKCIKPLSDLLRDTYWKVRTSACIAIGCLGPQASAYALPMLIRMLKDASVNKQVVGESIVAMGAAGVFSLIEFMKKQHQPNFKLRESIAKSLSTADVNDPTIDSVIELLFQLSNDQSPEVRKASLISLDILRKNGKEQQTYLKARNLLPFFYHFLGDKNGKVRKCAVLCIRNFGPYGELIFIEGLTKDKSPQIRRECSYGLGEIGPNTFRSLLLALHDSSKIVRDAVAHSIRKGMSVNVIMETFKNKPHQKRAIKCAIKEVFTLPFVLEPPIKTFLHRLLEEMEKENLGSPTEDEHSKEIRPTYDMKEWSLENKLTPPKVYS